MLSLQRLGRNCFAFDAAAAPPRVEGETYLGASWRLGATPTTHEGEVLIEQGDFQAVVFTSPDAIAKFFGKLDHVSPAIPAHAILRATDIVPLLSGHSDERLWVDRRYLPDVVEARLGEARLNNFHGVDQGFWLRPNRPLTEAEIKLIGYQVVSDDAALSPIDRAVPVHELRERGIVYAAKHFAELSRFGIEGIKAVSLTEGGLRMSHFKVIEPIAAAAVVPWLGHVAPGTTIVFDWPFKHAWRLGVSLDDLGKLEGHLGECIYDDGVLWIRHEHLRLRAGCAPVELKDHPTVRRQWILTSEETREKEFIAIGPARRTHVTRGLKRYELVEEGLLLTQLHHRKSDLTLARAKSDLAARKARLEAEYRTFDLPEMWERHSDQALATHFRVEQLVRDDGWSWRPREDRLDHDATSRFFAWMEREALSVTSPVSGRTCYRYSSPWQAIETHDPVELMRALYPKGSAFIFCCACRPDFAPRAMIAAVAS